MIHTPDYGIRSDSTHRPAGIARLRAGARESASAASRSIHCRARTGAARVHR